MSFQIYGVFILANCILCNSAQPEFLGGKNEINNLWPRTADDLYDYQKVRLRGLNRTLGCGRIEIYYRKRWNVVCGRFFTHNEADVACRWLGFKNGAKSFVTGLKYGSGSIKDLIPYKFNCNGSEADLFSCNKNLEKIFCDATKNTVSLDCRLNYNSYCAPGEAAFNKWCYTATLNQPLTFHQAQAYCEKNNGTLVRIRNGAAMNFLSEFLFTVSEHGNLDKPWYTAGYRSDGQSNWKWISRVSVEASKLNNWKTNLIGNKQNHCIALIQSDDKDYYIWDTVDCASNFNFVCQKSLNFYSGCINPHKERDYNGFANITMDSLTCKKWNDLEVFNQHPIFKDQTSMNHNYCRNPDNDFAPWCFSDNMKVSHCDVPRCASTTSSLCSDDELQCGDQLSCIPLDFTCDTEDDCGNGFDETGCENCGKRKNSSRVIRSTNEEDIFKRKLQIVGGHETNPGDYPWMASIKLKGKHHCGASIVDRFTFLTAAHCFDENHNAFDFKLVVGDWDNSVNDGHEVEMNVSRITIHPNYDGKDNDIAIIRSDTQAGLIYNEFIQPICISTYYTPVDINVKCHISGWGSLGENVQIKDQFPKRLQAAQIPMISRPECVQASVYGNGMPEHAFCAGFLDGGVDSCKGDSGSPLACQIKDRYYLFGIASRGRECAKANKPGLYTSVKHFAKWIRRQLLNRA